MPRRIIALGCVLAAACASREQNVPASVAVTRVGVDSVVLERTACYGTCPRYRLRVAGDGRVTFVSRNPGEDVTASDSVRPSIVDTLYAHAVRADFFALPDSIVERSPLCAEYATDHPGISLGVFGAQSKRVFYDTGCGMNDEHEVTKPGLVAIRALAAEVDSVTNARRWIRPGRFR